MIGILHILTKNRIRYGDLIRLSCIIGQSSTLYGEGKDEFRAMNNRKLRIWSRRQDD